MTRTIGRTRSASRSAAKRCEDTERPAVRFAGALYPLVDPDAVDRSELEWLSNLANNAEALGDSPRFKLRCALSCVEVALIEGQMLLAGQPLEEIVDRLVGILVPGIHVRGVLPGFKVKILEHARWALDG